jgi:hypothetical protein
VDAFLQGLSDAIATLNLDDPVSTYAWVWPVGEILHFTGMAVLIGTIGIIDARILGLFKGIPIKSLERYAWIGAVAFAVNAITGFIFIAGNPIGGPMEYLGNLSLQLKMLLVLIAGINLAAFYFTGLAKASDEVGADGSAPIGAKVVAGVSLVCWFGVICFGRLIMYNDTLLWALGM